MTALTPAEIDTLNSHVAAAGYTEDSPLWWEARQALHQALEANPEDVTGAYQAARAAAEARQSDLDLLAPTVDFDPGFASITWAAHGGFELLENHGEGLPENNGLQVGVVRDDWPEKFFHFPASDLDEIIDSLVKIRRARDLVATKAFELKDLQPAE
ncbi:hypothetical protein [Tsukamurella strandjordii]|uniref:Uncharacterized protein n=1 Tax=Tsukamurella strandjordii TaxID=147577 RepID=A0AA90SLX7_9ACTN|nr:hypothetical protein [Tsukamurella strandjordii]MDP0398707.1 hypothetical protein [Tsukamurella strandjordii]